MTLGSFGTLPLGTEGFCFLKSYKHLCVSKEGNLFYNLHSGTEISIIFYSQRACCQCGNDALN